MSESEETGAVEPSVVAVLQFKEPLIEATGRLLTSGDGVEGEEKLHTVQLLEGKTFRLGRAKSNDLVVQNRNVSRFHAVFSASASGVVLSDLSSLNGTFVNGSRISTPVDLSSGDVVTVGDTEISIKLGLGDGEAGDSTHGRTQTAQLAAVVVSVLVVDVCNYTTLSEALPPRDVAQMMHLWFQNVAQTVQKFGGQVDKYIGDCVMALWRGTAEDASAKAQQAIKAGMKMIDDTDGLSNSGEWQHSDLFPWRCRVAVNTGEALMGTVGGAGSRDFTVLGDTVNVAFRLEGIAGELNTNYIISDKTAELLGDEFKLKSLGEVNVAGRSGNVEVYTFE